LNVKKFTGITFPLFTLALLSRGLFVSDAYAYLDPTTGSIVIQMLVGALAGIGITLKIYWHRIKEKFIKH
jgi:hypothetical protein